MLSIAVALLVSATPDGGSRVAINATLDRAYPGLTDYPFGFQPEEGEEEPPLAEVVVYRVPKPTPHWQYVTYGLTELAQKTSTDAKLSGFGVEYTLSLVDDSAQPPAWPINLLRWLALRVQTTRHPFDPGHSVRLQPHMLDDVSKGIEGLAFYVDPKLGKITSSTGELTFVNVIPLMAGEYDLISAWDAFKVAEEIRTLQKDLLWRKDRKSLLVGDRRDVLRALAEKDGSSQSVDFADLVCSKKELVLDRDHRTILERILRHRIAYDRGATVISGDHETRFIPGKWQFTFAKDSCEVQAPISEARKLADEISKAADGAVIKRAGGLRFRIALDPKP